MKNEKSRFSRKRCSRVMAILSLLVICFIGINALGVSKASAAEDVIKIGVLSDITGAWSVYGQALANNVLLAVREINESGGILGKKVRVYVEDSATVPKTGVEKARKLVEQYQVDVVIGSISSAMRNAVKSVITKRNNTILIYPELYEGDECDKNIFCTGPVPPQQVDPFIPWLMERYGKKFYLVGMDYIYPRRTNARAKEAIKKHGGIILGEEYVPFGATDFTAVVNRMKAAKPDIFFNTYPGAGFVTFVNQLYNYGVLEHTMIATPVMRELEVAGLNKKISKGIVACYEYFMALSDISEPAKNYLTRYHNMFGENTYNVSVGYAAYVATYLFKEAVEKTKGDLSTEKLRAALKHVKFNGPAGPIEMVPKENHAIMNMYIGKVGDDGKFHIVEELGPKPPKQDCDL